MHDVPAQVRMLGALQLLCGLVNLAVGWGLAYAAWTLVGGIGSTVCTLGACPFGWFTCGFAGCLVGPLGAVEAIVGAWTLVNPASARTINQYLPLVQIPSVLLGDLVSPIVGAIAFLLLRDPEVAAYIEGSP